MKVEKLIYQYRQKIELEEKSIAHAKEKMSELRKAHGMDAYKYTEDSLFQEYKEDRKHAETLKQCYIQFISDLESLQD